MTRTQIGDVYGTTSRQGTSTQGEVQTLTGTASSGTFTLTFGTQTTSALTFDDSAADIQTALRALSNISATGVVCAGGPLGTNPVTVTFAAEYAAVDVPTLVVNSIDLAGGTVSVANTTAMAKTSFNDPDANTVEAMRARLTAIDGTTFSAANLDKMNPNDMLYALRLLDNPQQMS